MGNICMKDDHTMDTKKRKKNKKKKNYEIYDDMIPVDLDGILETPPDSPNAGIEPRIIHARWGEPLYEEKNGMCNRYEPNPFKLGFCKNCMKKHQINNETGKISNRQEYKKIILPATAKTAANATNNLAAVNNRSSLVTKKKKKYKKEFKKNNNKTDYQNIHYNNIDHRNDSKYGNIDSRQLIDSSVLQSNLIYNDKKKIEKSSMISTKYRKKNRTENEWF